MNLLDGRKNLENLENLAGDARNVFQQMHNESAGALFLCKLPGWRCDEKGVLNIFTVYRTVFSKLACTSILYTIIHFFLFNKKRNNIYIIIFLINFYMIFTSHQTSAVVFYLS